MHDINLLPAYLPTHLNVEAYCLSQGRLVQEWHLLPHIDEAVFQLWDRLWEDLLASSYTNQCQHYYILENPLPVGALGLNTFNHPQTFRLVKCFWQNMSQVNSDFLFWWHLAGWRLQGFLQFSKCW